jgi:hypothetical protein
MSDINRRYRAWLMYKTGDPRAAAEALAHHFFRGGDNYVVVRADVVEGADFNLMVPVDAAAEEWQDVRAMIDEVLLAAKIDVSKRAVAHVTEHHPRVPHLSDSFITESESAEDGLAKDHYRPGRHHPKSPGGNPWG